MIRSTVLAAALSVTLNACVIPIPIQLSQGCRGDQALGYVGQRYTQRIGGIVKSRTRSDEIRIIPPGAMVTQDARDDRVNVALDDKNLITRIYCG